MRPDARAIPGFDNPAARPDLSAFPTFPKLPTPLGQLTFCLCVMYYAGLSFPLLSVFGVGAGPAQLIRRLGLWGFPRRGRSMTYLINILHAHGFEFICPLFGGAIDWPLRDGAQVDGIEPDLMQSYGAALLTVDTICSAVYEGSLPIEPDTDVPRSSVDTGRPPRVPRYPAASLTPEDPESARTPFFRYDAAKILFNLRKWPEPL